MKNMKKFAAMMAALTLSACSIAPMAMTASAANKITISGFGVESTADEKANDAGVHTYAAYQVFSGTLSDGKLSDIVWGDGIDDSKISGIYVALMTKNLAFSKDGEDGKVALTSAEEIADVLATAENAVDDQLAKDFADVVANYLGTAQGTSNTSGEISNLNDGYYLVQDSASPTANGGANSGAKTRYILKVVGEDVTVKAKASAPSVMKKVKEGDLVGGETETAAFAGNANYDLGDGYNDVADYNIGDPVPFKLYGTLPSTYDDYKQYYYKFTDTLDEQFTMPAESAVKVYIDGEETTAASVVVNDTVLTVEFENLKNIESVTKNSVITVEYSAVLNSNAVIGLNGQRNKVDLTYSNNPNQESGGETETGKTPEDGVIVFTYGIDINKVDEDADKLAGAAFAVYKMNGSDKVYIAADANGKYVKASDSTIKPTVTKDSDGKAVNSPTTGVFVSSDAENSLITIAGLDDGTYYIEELEAPAGYNKLAGDITVVVDSKHGANKNKGDAVQNWIYGTERTQAEAALTELTFTKDGTQFAEDISGTPETAGTAKDGKGVLTIENKEGSALPSTGGIGTTLFYLGGGAMVAVAGVFLITKKRMGRSEN